MPGQMGGAAASGFPAAGASMQLGPAGAAPVYGGSAGMPAQPPQNSPLQSPPVAGAANAKKIHTVAIHNGQADNADAAQAAPAPQAGAPQSGAPARPQAVARPAAQRPAAAGGNAPLSIVPGSGGEAAAPRTRTAAVPRAAAEQAPSAAPSAGGGGYYVQVSSQRSEAEAQSAYRDLQAKFPSQLGGHAPAVRQVNLGDKGTFYRTLVGPYGSVEQAAQMCSKLKAAGGSCLVQRN
jgi:cell division protein FtsN